MLLIADNLHVVHPTIAAAVQQMDPEPIQRLVRRCETAGAQAIDINSGPLPRLPQQRFAFLVETVQAVTRLPLLLDTTNPAALEAGLAVCRNRAIINGFSLEPARIERVLPLAARFDAEIIGYLLDAESRVPTTLDEMMTVAVQLFDRFAQTGLAPQHLIVDPVVAPLSWQNGIEHNRSVLQLMRMLPDLLGAPVRTIAGISNLGSGPISTVRKITAEQTYLPMLAAAGLDMALLNIFHAPTVQTARACESLLGGKVFSWAEAFPEN